MTRIVSSPHTSFPIGRGRPSPARHLFLLLAIILFLSGCTPFSGWKNRDKVLYGSWVTLSAVDTLQTASCADREGCREVNPLFSGDEGKPNMPVVIGVKAAAHVGGYYLLNLADDDSRTLPLAVMNVLQGGVVVWNFTQANKAALTPFRFSFDAKFENWRMEPQIDTDG